MKKYKYIKNQTIFFFPPKKQNLFFFSPTIFIIFQFLPLIRVYHIWWKYIEYRI